MAIRWDKFTVKAQEAVQRGNDLASEHGNPELLPLHLLAALLEDKEGIVPPVLEKIGIGPQAVLQRCLPRDRELAQSLRQRAAQATISKSVNQLLERAFKEAGNFQGRIRFDRAPAAGGITHAEARSRAGNPGAAGRDLRRHSESADLGARQCRKSPTRIPKPSIRRWSATLAT